MTQQTTLLTVFRAGHEPHTVVNTRRTAIVGLGAADDAKAWALDRLATYYPALSWAYDEGGWFQGWTSWNLDAARATLTQAVADLDFIH